MHLSNYGSDIMITGQWAPVVFGFILILSPFSFSQIIQAYEGNITIETGTFAFYPNNRKYNRQTSFLRLVGHLLIP